MTLASSDRARLRALPVWGQAPVPAAREHSPDEDRRGFVDVARIFLRTWPWLEPMVFGVWRELAPGGAANRPDAGPWRYSHAPILVTAVAAAGPLLDVPPAGVDWQRDLLLAAGAVMAAASWTVLLARPRTQGGSRIHAVAAATLTLTAILATLFAVFAVTGWGDNVYAGALAVAAASQWLIQYHRAEGILRVRVRLACHLVYYYALVGLSSLVAMVAGLFTIDLLNQSILQAQPLTPFLADFAGRPDLGADAVAALTDGQRRELQWYYIVFTVGVATLTFPFSLALPYYNVWIMQQINQGLRLALVERWHQLSLRYHGDHRVGDSVYRIYQDSAQVTAVIATLTSVATLAISYVVAIVFVAALDPLLGLMAATVAVLAVLWARWFSPRMRSRSLTAREANSDLTSRTQEALNAARLVKACGAEAAEQSRFETDSVVAFNAAYAVRSLVAVVTIVMFTFGAAILLGGQFLMALWANVARETFAAVLIGLVGLSFTRWNLAAFQWGQGRLTECANQVGGLLRQWTTAQDMAMGLDRAFEILDIEPDVANAPDAVPFAGPCREVRFDSVRFAYQGDRPVLRDVSFVGRPGVTAIVGPTGAGKSTLMALLTRLFDPDAGRVTINGVDLRRFDVDSLRANVAIALQENVLFAMSVRENIRYAAPDAGDDQLRRAVFVSCVDEYAAGLPDGLDTVLGDRGGKLSTGQRQRLSIARAVIKDAPILVLDEPTAALDAGTEHRVLERLAAWAAGEAGQGEPRTVFLITHRLSTIRQADRILYLDAGIVAEQGSHAELMRLPGGRYRRFVETEQAAGAGS